MVTGKTDDKGKIYIPGLDGGEYYLAYDEYRNIGLVMSKGLFDEVKKAYVTLSNRPIDRYMRSMFFSHSRELQSGKANLGEELANRTLRLILCEEVGSRIAPPGFEPGSTGPEPVILDHCTMGL